MMDPRSNQLQIREAGITVSLMQTQQVATPPAETAESVGEPAADNRVGPDAVGRRVREERLRQNIGVRELARRVGVSASLVSQVELGKASPSVGTLYSIVNELGISLDELFFHPQDSRRGGRADNEAGTPPVQSRSGGVAVSNGIPTVVHHDDTKVIELASGVRWERLTPETPQDVDFLEVTYAVGSESCPANSLMRHSGHEYGHVLEGHMGVTVGFDTYELGPGDSVAFDSTMPHRLFTLGDSPVRAIWVVVGRRGDAQLGRS
jgi:ribosome-binding protein aMBF1 (putative translation factor)/mannose-6-phosphate isomerase-like protein (cupin superfamily)